MESQCLENLLQIQHLLLDDDAELNAEPPFRHYSSNVNVKQKNGENSLHILAIAIRNDNCAVIFEMMKTLISYGCNVNYPNSEDKTAFYILLENLPKLVKRTEILNYFLENVEIDFLTYRSKDMLDMMAKQASTFVLQERVPANFSFESMKKKLLDYNINKFETLFKCYKESCKELETYQKNCEEFMEIAVRKSFINIVDLLIEYGADINRIPKNSKLAVPPSFLACVEAKPTLLNIFLLHEKVKLSYENDSGNHQTLLHQLFKINMRRSSTDHLRPGFAQFTKEQKKCFDLLMNHPKCDRNVINENDENNYPAIYYAVKCKNDYATMRLLTMGAYIGTVICTIRKSLLEEFFNSTITTNTTYDDDDNELKIDYNFLWPPNVVQVNSKKSKNFGNIHQTEVVINATDQYSEEVKPLESIANIEERQYLLAHPTIATFIMLKWQKLSFLVYINLIIIVMFMLSFLPFAYLCQNLKKDEKYLNFSYRFFQATSLISLSCLIIREFTQAMLSIKQYVFQYSNWIDICLMSLATICLLVESELKPHWSRMLRILIILLATAQ